MNSYRKMFLAVSAGIVLSLTLSASAAAQGPATTDLSAQDQTLNVPASALPTNPVPQNAGSTNVGPATTSDSWTGAISIYGWFPGLHGTVGALDHNASIHSSFSDVFHVLKGIIPIAVEADKGRFVMPVDFFWVKLGINNGIPLNDFGQTSINTHLTESIFTPKVGYRLYNGEHFKVDALGGIRYWYLGLNNALVPSGLSNSRSANWVDGLGGARFIVPFNDKASILISGDAGAGGANLDYQVLGTLNFKFTQHLGMGVGWRYLYEDYRPSNHQFVYNTTMSGALAGFYYTFGGKPPVAPSASCSVSPSQVMAGGPVTAKVSTENFNPKHTISYAWKTSGGKVSGAGETGTVDTTGLAPGNYNVSATATDEKEKKNNVAICNASFSVMEPPRHPPVASCSANPSTVQAGNPVTITSDVSSPDNSPISSVSYSASAGRITGSGNTATHDTTGLPSGSVTVTVTATDARGLTGTGNCSFGVEVPPAPPQVSARTPIEFVQRPNQKYIPWRVDNTAKAILDDDASALKSDPNAKLVIVGFADGEPPVYEGKGKNKTQMDLAAQRAVNAKAYLVQQQGIDASRIDVRKGTGKDHAADIYLVPQGADVATAPLLQGTTPVDESVVKPSENAFPKPHAEAPAHHHKAAESTTPQ